MKEKCFTKILTVILGICFCIGIVPIDVQAASKNVVVTIDPGHGGSNLGGQYGEYTEKYMTMITALSMKEELEKYQGITVYLTHTADVDTSLAARAQVAKSVNSDYLFSLHYNMSAERLFYGSEVWIPSTGINYAKGYSLGDLVLTEFDKKGIFNRGIKTKINKKGEDYYGVIRESTSRGIPSILIEHCHIDNGADTNFFDAYEDMQSFGRDDATAVAKYFGLKSETLGVDYSNYAKTEVPSPALVVSQDLTPPEVSTVTIQNNDSKKQQLSISIEGQDLQSGLLYYSYSNNGGMTWSSLTPFPTGQNKVTLTIPYAQEGLPKTIMARVYNGYDGKTESSPVSY